MQENVFSGCVCGGQVLSCFLFFFLLPGSPCVYHRFTMDYFHSWSWRDIDYGRRASRSVGVQGIPRISKPPRAATTRKIPSTCCNASLWHPGLLHHRGPLRSMCLLRCDLFRCGGLACGFGQRTIPVSSAATYRAHNRARNIGRNPSLSLMSCHSLILVTFSNK